MEQDDRRSIMDEIEVALNQLTLIQKKEFLEQLGILVKSFKSFPSV